LNNGTHLYVNPDNSAAISHNLDSIFQAEYIAIVKAVSKAGQSPFMLQILRGSAPGKAGFDSPEGG
jgi:hypothetical protein